MKFFDEIITDSGGLHRFSWLIGFPGMNSRARYNLEKNIAEMYEGQEDIRVVKNEEYDARIVAKGVSSIGFLRGKRYDATIETGKIKTDLSLMILENPNPRLN